MKSHGAVTRIGWIALGLSILGLALVLATGGLFNLGLANASNVGSTADSLLPWSLLATVPVMVSAITVDIIARNRGFGNRRVGTIGGVILLSPVLVALGVALFAPLLFRFR